MTRRTFDRNQRLCILILLEHLVPLCVRERTADVPLSKLDPVWVGQKAMQWRAQAMSEAEFAAFETTQTNHYAHLLATVSPKLKDAVFSRALTAMQHPEQLIGEQQPVQHATTTPAFHPISGLPAVTELIDTMLFAATANYQNLKEAQTDPSTLETTIIPRIQRLFSDMQSELPFYHKQLKRWGKGALTACEQQEIQHLTCKLKELRATIAAILTLTDQLLKQGSQ